MRHLLPSFFLLSFLAFSSPATARWSDKSEYPSTYELYQAEYKVDKSGSYRETAKLVVKVNNEAGKTAGNYRVIYNSANSTARILSAKVANNGKATEVPGRYIEEKSIPANVVGTDKLQQLVVNFQDVQVGSLLELDYLMDRKVPEIPGYFRYGFLPSRMPYIEKLDIRIVSEVPLHFEKRDSRHLLRIEESKADGEFIYSLRNEAPLSFATQEERDPYVAPPEETFAFFSSAGSHAEIARRVLPLIEEKYAYAADENVRKVIERARAVASPVEQINLVTDWVISGLRYLKDYKKEHSGDVPRDLEEILATRFGDCKDFSLLTSYILRQLGYRAHTAWVHRGYSDGLFPEEIAYDPFNHAIVFAEKGASRYWIDPTNRVNYSQGIFPDIENRPALVLDPDSPRIEKTSALPAERNRYHIYSERDLGAGESGSVYRFSFFDAGAIPFTGIGNERSKKEIKYFLLRSATEERNVISSAMDSPELKARTVDDVNMELKVQEKILPIKSSAGTGMALPVDSRVEKILAISTKDRVSGLNLGSVGGDSRTTLFKRLRLIGKPPASCSIRSRWISAERKVVVRKATVKVEDSVTTHRKYFLASELQSEDFRGLQERLSDCFKDVYVIYRPVR